MLVRKKNPKSNIFQSLTFSILNVSSLDDRLLLQAECLLFPSCSSASNDDLYYAQKIILSAGGQFLEIEFGHVTSASDDDHYYAQKIILVAGGQFLKIKKEIISYSLFVQDLWSRHQLLHLRPAL